MLLTNQQRVEAVERSCLRSAAMVHRNMNRGLTGLATVASTGPFLGFLGTVLGIFNSFQGCGSDKATVMAAITKMIAEAFVPAALALSVAIGASFCYKCLAANMETFDAGMRNASSELAGYLALHLRRRDQFQR
jgi:biopolymer transport protein ExbB/TolQ